MASSNRASLVYNKRVGDSGEFKWINFAHKSDRSFQFAQPFDPAEEPTVVANSPRAFTVFGTEPRYTYSFNTGEVSHKVTIGARYLREEVDFVVDRTELASGHTETARDWYFETDAYAAYISDTMLLMNDRLEVTPGLRFEHVDTVFRNNLDDTTSRNKTTEALPGLAVSYAADNGVFLFGNANRSLRVPQVAQVTREGEVSNELAWNYELGMRYAPAAGINLGASLFRIDFSDQIEFDRPSLSFKNLGETRHQGIELTADWSPVSLPDLTVQANYTYTDTEQRSGDNIGNEVPFSSRHQVNLGLDYEVENWTFGINGSYRSAAFSDAANTGAETGDGSAGQLPSAWIWDLHASKVLDVPRQNIRLTGAINNVFDEEYYLRGVDVSPVGRVPHPGRSLSVALQVDF